MPEKEEKEKKKTDCREIIKKTRNKLSNVMSSEIRSDPIE